MVGPRARGRPRAAAVSTLPRVGDWYEIGVALGLGLGAGVLFAGLLGATRFGLATSAAGAVVVGVVAGLLVNGWVGVGGGVVGAVVGAVSAAAVVRGASRRGSTAGGTALILTAVAIVVAALGLIPVVGYAEVVALPVLAARRARSGPQKYAGLRSLAK